MTLRWRLTLFYTSLIAVLLTVVFTTVYFLVGSSLTDATNRELNAGLTQVMRATENSSTKLPTTDDWNSFSPDLYAQVEQFLITPPTKADDFNQSNGPLERSLALSAIGGNVVLSASAYGELVQTGFYRGNGDLRIGDQTTTLEVIVRALPTATLDTGTTVYDVYPYVYVAKDFATTQEILRVLASRMFFVALLGITTAGLLSFSLARRALEPIREVRDAAAEITGKNLNRRVPEPGTHDEVEDLARTLNGMLERLENSFETQRRFTADASHELRTPVTAIAGHASYLLRRTSPSEAQKESLEAISSLSTRLGRLIGDLLDLARADAGFGVEPVETNLVALAEDVHLEVAAIAGNAEIEIQGSRDTRALVDPHRFRQVIRNLVQNALKAGSSRVVVEVTRENDHVRLSVTDNGSGIAPEHLSKLFDRFYRVDSSRDRGAGGSGLGLSIVKWIVEAHQGELRVSSVLGEGSRFDVILPPVPANPTFVRKERPINVG
jgi:two-component system, OmpR family, sensor kinase